MTNALTPPDADFAQRVAFAVAASLLVHVLLLPDISAGTLRFVRSTGTAPVPVRVSMRTTAPNDVAVRLLPSGLIRNPAARYAHAALPQRTGSKSQAAADSVAASAEREPADSVAVDLELPANPERSPHLNMPADDGRFGSYRAITDVDVRPLPLVQVEPKFPSTVKAEISGKVILLVLIGNDGLVDQVQILTSEPKPDFGESAKAAFEQARFTPAEVRGTPVPSYLTVEVNFG